MTSLYIHIPFCRSKCHFCSFVISVGSEHHINSYLESLEREAKYYKGAKIKTIYIGGGTPTYMNNDQLKELVDIIHRNFEYSSKCEFTIEANAEGLNFNRAKLLCDLGINRVSLGIQSLSDTYLQFLGRRHKAHDAVVAFGHLREAGFTNINVDLMYSFPNQTKKEIEKDIKGLARLNSEHISLYALTVEEKSKFYIKKLKLPDHCSQADQYIFVKELLQHLGFNQYEVSNFAKQGKESVHNLIYWQGGNYVGLGIGAHSHLNGERSWNVARLHEYIAMTKKNIRPISGCEKLNPYERFIETLLFGLRMNKGVSISELEERFRCALDEKKEELINQFLKNGMLKEEKGRLKTTTQGQLLLDELCSRLI